jgi:hypothetical protein
MGCSGAVDTNPLTAEPGQMGILRVTIITDRVPGTAVRTMLYLNHLCGVTSVGGEVAVSSYPHPVG